MSFIGDLFKPDIPAPPPVEPPPTRADDEVEKAKRLQRMMAARQTGYQAMFATSRAGATGAAPVIGKRLFGE